MVGKRENPHHQGYKQKRKGKPQEDPQVHTSWLSTETKFKTGDLHTVATLRWKRGSPVFKRYRDR
jgi:hypothetical protein